MTQVRIFSRTEAESVEYECPHAWVSIYTPRDVPAALRTNDRTVGVCVQRFHDLDDRAVEAGAVEDWVEPDLFSDEQAGELAAFLRKVWGVADKLLIHCDAGISRSPAVGAAALKHFTGDDSWIFRDYYPNMRVFRKLLNALHDQAGQ